MRAFTLIELLVVISIIVVLLALLTPALDKAIYQAELAACGASLHAGVTGYISYATGNQRAYPSFPSARNPPCFFVPGGSIDYRALTRNYVGTNGAYNDPLSQKVDYEDPNSVYTGVPLSGSYGFAARMVWPGFQYTLTPGESIMRRIGDKWTYTNTDNEPTPVKWRFATIISDIDFTTTNNTQQWSSHPDRSGVLQQAVYQNTIPPEQNLIGVAGAGVAAGNQFVMSRWWIAGGPRGLTDLNFGQDDGSVVRYTDVAWSDIKPGVETGNLRGVPWNSNNSFTGQTPCSVPLVP